MITDQKRHEVEISLQRWKDFEDQAYWSRTRRGNLTRVYDGQRVTVFKNHHSGLFGWCISSTIDEVEFSKTFFDTEEESRTDLGEYLGVSL
ncbi:MAG TPA: hypothetical protein PLY87_10360 [Planctomycetaceae bacterium]|nr:hypothetical protein [Planctomycetaceae bacterium]